MATLAAPASGRLEYLDLLRGLFILIMIEGHVLRLFLPAEVKAGALFQRQELIHNLTGPLFLFASGAAFVYSSLPRSALYRRWNWKLRGRLGRWLMVLVAGYGLQLTFGSLRRTLAESTPEQLAYLMSLNILQCIVYSLLVLQALFWCLPGWRWFCGAAAAMAAMVALLTPFAWQIGQDAPYWLAGFLNGRPPSYFPLFPYTGFALAGAAWGSLHLRARERGIEDVFLRRTAWLAAGCCLASLALMYAPLPAIYADFCYTSPLTTLLRTGVVALLVVGARLLEPHLLPRWEWLIITGRQSLLIYILHLVVLYGSAFNPDTSMRKALGVPLGVAESLAAWLALTLAMVAFAWGWDRWRATHRWQARGVWWAVGAYYSYRFFLG